MEKETSRSFSQETTWHGVKYIFEGDSRLSRRLAWLLLCLAAAAAFIILMVVQLLVYFERPSQVNLSVAYKASLPFPAVTICNQNPYRLEALQTTGMFDAVLQSHNLATFAQTVAGSSCHMRFELRPHICAKLNEAKFSATYRNTSMDTCTKICVFHESERCSAIVYSPQTQQCNVTSLIATAQGSDARCFASPDALYYRRHRCPDRDSFYCDFESTDCPLDRDTSAPDSWHIVPGRDKTTARGSGKYMNFLESGIRAGYSARQTSPFMDTTNKCLFFFYRFLGEAVGRIDVISIHEDLTNQTLRTIKGSHPDMGGLPWLPAVVRLSPGVHRVALQATRPSEGISGASIDDVQLNTCSHLERECQSGEFGELYLGHVNQSADGTLCTPWASHTDKLTRSHHFAEETLSEASNYCRHPTREFNAPFCLDERGGPKICDIDKCGCKEEDAHMCSTGKCVADRFLCDGFDDCPEGSDETTSKCAASTHMACSFDDQFICGYSVTQDANPLRWALNKRLDGHNSVLYLTRFNAEPGDKSTIMSPTHNFSQPTFVTFKAIVHSAYYDTLTQLVVSRVDNETGTHTQLRRLQRVKEANGTGGALWLEHTAYQPPDIPTKSWVKHDVCMPAGGHALRFEAVMGDTKEAYIGLDDVIVTQNACQPKETSESGVATADCSFNKGLCDYVVETDSTFMKWEQISKDNIENALSAPSYRSPVCSGETYYYDASGSIASSGFPRAYNDHLDCSYVIIQPPKAQVIISFTSMELEFASDCQYDFLKVSASARSGFSGSQQCNRNESCFCGFLTPDPLTFKDGNVTLCLHTDFSEVKRGFLVEYRTSLVEGHDYAVGLSYHGDQVIYSNNATVSMVSMRQGRLVSPWITIDASYCLSFDLWVEDTLEVALRERFLGKSQDSIIMVVGHTVGSQDIQPGPEVAQSPGLDQDMEPGHGLGRSWHTMHLTIQEYGEKAVVFQAISGQHSTYQAFIDNVKLEKGTCREKVTKGTMNCDFNTPDQCGYVDETQGTQRWTRACDGATGDCHMQVSTPSYTFSRMESINQTVPGGSCLRYKIFCTECDFIVDIMGGEAIDILFFWAPEFVQPYQWSDMTMPLPPGKYPLSVMAVGGPGVIAIDDIRVDQDPCPETVPLTESGAASGPTTDSTIFGGEPSGLMGTESSVEHGADFDGPYYGKLFPNVSRIKRTPTGQFGQPELPLDDFMLAKWMEDTPLFEDIGSWLNRQSWEYLITLLGDSSLSHFVKTVSGETFLSCQWAGSLCKDNMTLTTVTDMGKCLTFNGNNQTTLQATSTGVDSGLQLWMDIADYQYIPGIAAVSGVKVLFHKQDDVPLMRNLGFNLGPGQHVLASLALSNMVFLPPPYGTCGTKDLSHFRNESYTYSRCIQQRETEALERRCHCEHIHMNGDEPECDMQSYLSCVIQYEATFPEVAAPGTTPLAEDSEGCVGACANTEYRHDLSTTPLSEAVISYFGEIGLQRLTQRYQTALEVRQRVTGKYLPEVLNQITAVEDSLKDIESILRFNVFSEKTSLFTRIDSAVGVLLSRVEQDMASLYAEIDVYQQAYKTHLMLDRDTLVAVLRDVIKVMSEVVTLTRNIAWLSSFDKMTPRDTLRQIDIVIPALQAVEGNATSLLDFIWLKSGWVDTSRESVRSAQVDAMAAVELAATLVYGKERREQCRLARNHVLYLANIVDFIRSNVTGLLRTTLGDENTQTDISQNGNNETEETTVDSADENLSNTADDIDIEILSESYGTNLKYADTFILRYQDNIETVINCLSAYRTFLMTIKTNRDKVMDDIRDKKLTGRSMESKLTEIEMLRREIKEVYRKYSSLEMTKLEMELTLSERVNQTFWIILRDIEGHLERSYVAPRLSKFDELKDTLLSAYMTGIHDVIELGEYFSQPEARGLFTDRAKALYLWREPVANLDSAERVIPRQNTYYGDVTIPNVASLLKTNGQERIKNILEDFFTSLSNEMDAFQSLLLKQRLQLQDRFEELQGNLQRFRDMAQIDAEFIRRNVLRLDIYFSQLREEKTTQTVAYGLPDFGGDLGGYMGLFLGASALSVVEVLDWMICKIMKSRRDASRKRRPTDTSAHIEMLGNSD